MRPNSKHRTKSKQENTLDSYFLKCIDIYFLLVKTDIPPHEIKNPTKSTS